jgi:hypothetical protein
MCDLKNKRIVLVFLVFIIVGCKKTLPGDREDFEGKWTCQRYFSTIEIQSNGNVEYSNSDCGSKECYVNVSGHAKFEGDYFSIKQIIGKPKWKFHIDEYPVKLNSNVTSNQGVGFNWRMKISTVDHKNSYGKLDSAVFYRQ